MNLFFSQIYFFLKIIFSNCFFALHVSIIKYKFQVHHYTDQHIPPCISQSRVEEMMKILRDKWELNGWKKNAHVLRPAEAIVS